MKSKLDRKAELRDNPTIIKKWLTDPNARYLPAWNNQFLTKSTDSLLSLSATQRRSIQTQFEPVYLGHMNHTPWFMLAIAEKTTAQQLTSIHSKDKDTPSEGTNPWRSVRSIAWQLKEAELPILLYASGLFQWHKNHQYCPKCGSLTQPSHVGHARKCAARKCGKLHFPRIEPAVIFSIEKALPDNQSEILLARQPGWPKGRYSVIAGFVEPGETLEEAVHREALEEVGIRLSSVNYHGSQPWPFPASLMIAYQTVAKSGEIRLNDGELEAAHWFTVKQFEQSLRSGDLIMPFSISVSAQLISEWYQRNTGRSLKDLLRETNEQTQN